MDAIATLKALLPQEAKHSTMQSLVDAALQRMVDAGIVALIVIAPLFLGGLHPVGRFVFVLLVACTALLFAARQLFNPDIQLVYSPAIWLLLAGGCLLLLQLTPHPESWLQLLSPRLKEVLPLWSSQGDGFQIGIWKTVSFAPEATRGGAVMYVAYVLFFLVLLQRIRSLSDAEWLLRVIAVGGVLAALIGLMQYTTGNGKFMWIYRHPVRTTSDAVQGPFVNPNHFAHMMALVTPALLWWMYSVWTGRQQPRQDRHWGAGIHGIDYGRFMTPALVAGTAIVVIAGMLSYSLGGVAIIFVTAISYLVIGASKGVLSRRALLLPIAAVLLSPVLLLIHGYESLKEEMAAIGFSSPEQINSTFGRLHIWKANWECFRDFKLLGTGVGTHAEVYPLYFDGSFLAEYTHAESSYVQLLSETGGLGITLTVVGLSIVGWWCYIALARSRDTRSVILASAAIAGVVASVFHSVWDFVWFVPACLSTAICFVVIARCVSQASADGQTSDRLPASPLVRGVVMAGVAGVSLLAVANRWSPAQAAPSWDRYLCLALSPKPTAPVGESETTNMNQQAAAVLGKTNLLRKTVQLNPNHARGHLRLAGSCLRLFELKQKASDHPMELADIREAALASNFPSRQAQEEWLARVVPENRLLLDEAFHHTRLAVKLCPLQGEAYIYAAELAFLRVPSLQAKKACVEQATLVRPNAGLVLVAAGADAALRGELEQALELWKRAFHCDADQQKHIVQVLGVQIAAEEFIQQFEPDTDGLRQLFNFYRDQDESDGQVAARAFAVALEKEANQRTGRMAANYWSEARMVYAFLADHEATAMASANFLKHAPDHFQFHRYHAQDLVKLGRYDEAIDALRWCLRRRLNEPSIQQEIEDIQRLKYRVGGATSPPASPDESPVIR